MLLGSSMRASHRLLPVVIAAVVLASPLGMLAAHTRCVDERHACRNPVLVDRCCCDVLDARGTDPTALQTLPGPPLSVVMQIPDRTAGLPTTSAVLRVADYPPPARHVSLNILFATLLI